MALLNDPQFLFGSSGNLLSRTTLNNYPNSPSSVVFTMDVSNSLSSYLQLWTIGSSNASTTNGVYFENFSTSDNQWYDTTCFQFPFTLPVTANSISRQTFVFGPGKYQIRLTNTDPTYTCDVLATSGNLV